MDPDVPLVVPEVNAHALANIPKGIVANPNCTTMVCMAPLGALHAAAGLRRLVVSTYQSVSGSGVAGFGELASQVANAGEKARELTWNGDAVDFGEPSVYSGPIAYNVLADAGFGLDDGVHGETKEERKFRDESRKILGIDDLDVICTCVRVPVFAGHSVSLVAEFERPCLAGRRRERFSATRRASMSWICRRRSLRPASTTRSSAASAKPARLNVSRSSCAATTSARAPRSTPSRSPSTSSRAPNRAQGDSPHRGQPAA